MLTSGIVGRNDMNMATCVGWWKLMIACFQHVLRRLQLCGASALSGKRRLKRAQFLSTWENINFSNNYFFVILEIYLYILIQFCRYRYQHSVRWDSTVCEVVLVGAQVYRSLVPWQKKGAPTQAFQVFWWWMRIGVFMYELNLLHTSRSKIIKIQNIILFFQLIYCDDTMKVIYQAGTMLEREVYMLWKRVPPVVWKKY